MSYRQRVKLKDISFKNRLLDFLMKFNKTNDNIIAKNNLLLILAKLG
jgi:hypothetical protein